MSADTLAGLSRRNLQLQYVAAHFCDLQGLRTAPFWASLTGMAALAASGLVSPKSFVWPLVAFILLSFSWAILGGRWYERRYGMATEQAPSDTSGMLSIFGQEGARTRNGGGGNAMSGLLWLLLVLWLLPSILGSHFSAAPIVIIGLLVPRCFYPTTPAWPVRLRRILAIAVLGTSTVTYLCFAWAGSRLLPWMACLFAAMLVLDLYDHWLLTRLLSGQTPGAEHA